MSRANIGWLFYKEMYRLGDSDKKIKETLSKILKIRAVDEMMNAKDNFRLKTLYPGLLIGSGYAHGLSSDYDVKIGFYFDHTTGLPLIQGSSIKGLLRSCFGLAVKGQTDKYEKEKHKLIKKLLGKELDIKALANEIFEGLDSENKAKSIYERDIFYEARVVEIEEGKYLLSEDYITPHGENICSEPRPIKFIKVSPEVTFEFSFDLKDTLLATAEEKRELFMNLIEMFGVGAKTNVGYGQLELVLTDEEKEENERRKHKREKTIEIEKRRESREEENKGLSKFEILKKELTKDQKAETLHKKIKKEIESLINEEKIEFFISLAAYIKKDKSLDTTISREWLEDITKKEAEGTIGKWHLKTLKLFL